MAASSFFYATFGLCVCLGIICVVFVSSWNSRWRGGFAWDGTESQFNWHPVLMVTGLLVLYGLAAVLYRIPCTWSQRKQPWKLLHAGLMLAALLLSIVGLSAVFDVHRSLNIPHMYSLHSWVGMCTVVTFACQWLLGLAGFLVPCSPLWFRAGLKPLHIWLGKVVLMLGLASCISGINENLFFVLDGVSAEAYSLLPAEAQFANTLGVLIVAFGVVVFGILAKADWQRPNTDNEEAPLLLREEAI
uniref:lysosomal membrane ascorbate-dependent ferrireductase CYB561A3-like n=1 Tax=Doryrhamphus excisus TaxID=161450 RepID=UPI0025ADE20E|nr:lysosomal membrane ascorbate-dependent ferrireductase CYB561A3-like [Doryrhamphus excisus]XP_057913303.1 lysosomal membrane ascorbate-dependent ferrireductase CYB561A3-like [Doryrhamphus excisus]XP_057913304.1 lysosomal membrane ascorbate-dependent ferrireductase CYB561A3-like [Doryrhamphus excisus]XP_057913305.1 lysosomal membrane ascorbate-dependent ferrireductase CYB561A3-like [Doryrhamphus excisus]XP_057913306.1 lysosomal membrane ascorbate-dependent ferrireductase CYB561A3-like [Doryrha